MGAPQIQIITLIHIITTITAPQTTSKNATVTTFIGMIHAGTREV